MRHRLVGGVVVIVLAAFVAIRAYDAGLWRFHDPTGWRGVDVSHHQGPIDWPTVRASGFSFAYVKATEGGDFVDSQFARNWQDATDAGLAVGAYHFFSLCSDPEAQARNFTKVVPTTLALAPVVDLEFGGNCAPPADPVMVCRDVDVFIDRVEASFDRSVVLYATEAFLSAYAHCLPTRRLWVRAILLPPRHEWALWQFANRARVPGIVGPVDLDLLDHPP